MDGTTVAVNVAVVGVGADDAATRTAAERLAAAGHEVVDSKQLAAGAPLLEVLTDWIDDDRIDVVIAIANDTEPVRAAMAPLVSREIPGFGELLRAAAFSEIGSAAMLLEGEAARCGATYVFVLPGTVGAVKVAMDHLLLPQLDLQTRPLNLASRLPRLRGRAPAETAFVRREREGTDPGFVPPKHVPPARPSPSPAPRIKTMPPPLPDKAPSKTPPLGVVLRATPVEADAAKDAELLTSDAALLIPPAVLVDAPDATTAEIVDKPPPADAAPAAAAEPPPVEAAPAAAAEPPKAELPKAEPPKIEPPKIEPPKPEDTVAADQLGAFVMSLEKHAAQIRREKSQVGPLPTAPAPAEATMPADTTLAATAPADTAPPAIAPAQTTPPATARSAKPTPPPPAPRSSKTTPPPAPPAKTAPPTEKSVEEPAARRKKNETTPQQWAQAAEKLEKISPRAARDPGALGTPNAVLGQGDRVIVIPQSKKRRTWLVVPLLLVVGAAGAFVVKTQFLSGNRTASADPQPDHIEQTVKVEAVEPVTTPPPSDQPAPLPPVVPQVTEIEMEPGTGNLTAIAQGHGEHHAAHAAVAPTAPATGSAAAGSASGSADDAPDPRTHPNIAPASPDCDEASCILEHYQRECCARYKPPEMPAEKIDPNALPDTLDKAAVKAGIADVKPAVQQCGEDHYAKGTVKITLTVNAAGQVSDATVSAAPDPALGSCVADALKRATFAKTTTGAVFTYPFMF